MKTTKNQLCTVAQKRRLWALFNKIGVTKDAIEEMVNSISSGRTVHSSELNYKEAEELIIACENSLNFTPQNNYNDDANKWRKRVISTIGKYLENQGYDNNIDTIKAIAERIAKQSFNAITINRLRSIYGTFNNYNNDYNNGKNVVKQQTKDLSEYIQLTIYNAFSGNNELIN